jgi:hypothetical protein
VKNQYFGDINDYRKYSLLRNLVGPGDLETVVCWALTQGDGRSDGSRIRYLEDPDQWRRHDPIIFDCLRDQVMREGRRCVSALEASGVIPNCRFFSEPLSDEIAERERYFDRLAEFAEGADLLFLDPDNGLGVNSIPRGRKHSSKYVYWEEIGQLYESGVSLLVYQHFPRVNRDDYVRGLLGAAASRLGVRSVLSFRTSHVLFLLFPQPEHNRTLGSNAKRVLTRWRRQVQVGFHEYLSGSASWSAKTVDELNIGPLDVNPTLATS